MSRPAAVSNPRDRLFHLRPVFTMQHKAAGGLLEMAPWADVILLLLMLFMAHTAVLRKPGVAISLPAVLPNAAVPYSAHVLTAIGDGVFFFADERMDRDALSERLREAAARDPSATLLIEADAGLSHQAVMEIYHLAIEAGWRDVVLAADADRPVNQVEP